MSNRSSEDDDLGPPLPDFRASGIQLHTIAPALGVSGGNAATPDYLDYDPKGRGIVVTMFANAGMSYLVGIGAGGLYGFRQGLRATPSNRFRVQLNSVLNHSGRHGSRMGNTLGVFSVLYSLYEGLAYHVGKKLMRIMMTMMMMACVLATLVAEWTLSKL
jgi:Tim17/Tim22/Tim23/Pmp24 family